jgi:hypothetical protein
MSKVRISSLYPAHLMNEYGVLRIWIRIDSGPDPGGQQCLTKKEKSEEISCSEELQYVIKLIFYFSQL